jgi:hypothetical protein
MAVLKRQCPISLSPYWKTPQNNLLFISFSENK